MIRGEPQPQALPSTSASTSDARPMVSVATPGKSTVRATVSSREFVAANSVTTTQTIATGTLTKKIDCHDTCSTRKPPSSGPIASARPETPAQVPIALPRSSGGNALEMIDRVPGIIRAAPLPCSRRPTTSQVCVCAKPMNALLQANTTTPMRNTVRRPKMSPRRPPVTSRTAKASVYALTVHSRPAIDASRSRWMDGRATFTAVLSSITMNSAKHIAPSVHQRLLSSFSRSRLVMRRPPGPPGRGRGRRAAARGARDRCPARRPRARRGGRRRAGARARGRRR